MSKETATAALQSLTDEEADLLNNSPDLLEKFKEKHGLSAPQQPSVLDNLSKLNPMEMLKQASPSNALKLAGVASANAPDLANIALSLFPASGATANVGQAIQSLRSNPAQAGTALRRIAQVNSGEPLQQKEVLPARMGQVAGTGLEMIAPRIDAPLKEASGPGMAGLVDSTTALPGAFKKAGEELGAAKIAARAGEDLGDAKLMRIMLQKPAGVTKIAETAKDVVDAGSAAKLSVTRLLAFKEALGKAQAMGGTFANDYKVARDVIEETLAKKAPVLSQKLERMALQYVAEGNPKASFPWFTFALNPEVGLAKAAMLPVVRNTAGAVAGEAFKLIPKIVPVVKEKMKIKDEKPVVPDEPQVMKKQLTRDVAVKFLKKAKGDKKLAEQLAKDKGYDTEKLVD